MNPEIYKPGEDAKTSEVSERKEPYERVAENLRNLAEKFARMAETEGSQTDEDWTKRQETYLRQAEETLKSVLASVEKINRGQNLSGHEGHDYLSVDAPKEAIDLGYGEDKVKQEYRAVIYGALAVDPHEVKDSVDAMREQEQYEGPKSFKTNIPHTSVIVSMAGPGSPNIRELIEISKSLS